ncbi:MAG: hypothetical protein AAGB35_01065 [Pseudomonadota bacterium]
MKILHTRNVFKLCIGFVLSGLILNTQSFAVGTDESTPVDNQATISYSVGGTAQSPILSDDPSTAADNDATRFLVDELIDMSITASPAAPGATASVGDLVILTVTNTGNGTQDFLLNYLDFSSGDDLDLSSVTFYEDDGNGTFEGTETVITEVNLLEDETKTVFALAILAGSTNSDEAAVHWTLEASDGAGSALGSDDGGSVDDPTTVEIVFADGENTDVATNTASSDAVEDGLVSSSEVRYTIAGLIVQKTVATTASAPGVTNDGVNHKAVPGATVTYTIAIENQGSSSVTDVSISDTVPNPELVLSLPSVDITDTNCAGAVDASAGNTVTVNSITIAASATCTVTFDAVIQ